MKADLRTANYAAWCERCKSIVAVGQTLAEAEKLAELHDRTAHPKNTPPQNQFDRDLVRA